MTSIVWNNKHNPSVEIVYIQRKMISECMSIIRREITDICHDRDLVNRLFDQLKQLCQIHFLYEEQLLEELNYPAASDQIHRHNSFLSSIDQFLIEYNQCCTSNFLDVYLQLRIEFISNMVYSTTIYNNYLNSKINIRISDV